MMEQEEGGPGSAQDMVSNCKIFRLLLTVFQQNKIAYYKDTWFYTTLTS